MSALLDRPIGIYEKALAPAPWPAMLGAARSAGFDFVEMSIDESEDRLARLEWTQAERRTVLRACRAEGVPIFSICLSGHRRFGLGSADAGTRVRAAEMLDAAIGLACDLGVRVVQIAGYYAFYERVDSGARARYLESLRSGTELAARRGVMLAVENIDTRDVASVSDCLAVRDAIASPWFQIYPDVGNLALHGFDVRAELALLPGAAVGLHLKDTRPGQPRRVGFGEGCVPFGMVFRTLAELAYEGPFTVEMWNDDAATMQSPGDALKWLKGQMNQCVERAGVTQPA